MKEQIKGKFYPQKHTQASCKVQWREEISISTSRNINFSFKHTQLLQIFVPYVTNLYKASITQNKNYLNLLMLCKAIIATYSAIRGISSPQNQRYGPLKDTTCHWSSDRHWAIDHHSLDATVLQLIHSLKACVQPGYIFICHTAGHGSRTDCSMSRGWTPLLCIGTSTRVSKFSAGYSYDLEKPLEPNGDGYFCYCGIACLWSPGRTEHTAQVPLSSLQL